MVNENNIRDIVESVNAIIWEYDIKSDEWTYVSPQTKEILGYNPNEWTGLKFWVDHIHEDDRSWAKEYCFKCAKEGNDHIFEYRFEQKNGDYIWLRDEVKVFMQKQEPIKLRGFMIDVTNLKKREKRVKHQSLHDELTGLYNRRYFEDTISRLDRSRKVPIGVITADIDNLKQINDHYGHSIGDEYIKETAKVINSSVRAEDIVSRIGGDEFTVILPEIVKKDLDQIVKRIRSNINNIDVKNIDFDVSIGLAIKKSDEQALEYIVKTSDKIMYKKKKQKKENDLKRKLSILKNKEKIVFEEFPISICFADLNGNIIEVNNEFCKLLGYRKQELKEMTFFEITRVQDRELNRKCLDRIKKKEIEEYKIDKKYINKNGKDIDVHLKSKVIKDYKDEPVYLFAFIEEI